jgi:hypothetical protein
MHNQAHTLIDMGVNMKPITVFLIWSALALAPAAIAQTDEQDDAVELDADGNPIEPLVCPAGQYLCAENLCCPE